MYVSAGLCHDLGHGPFSHVYDGVFVKKMWPKGIDSSGSKWRHEDGSVRMFNYLLESNKIDIARYAMTERDKLFIEEVIGGVKESDREGRPASKFFLYDIVNNALSGLDVDKLDYFQRDMRMANVKLQADFDRYVVDGAPLSCPHKVVMVIFFIAAGLLIWLVCCRLLQFTKWMTVGASVTERHPLPNTST
jgi:HD superfamily phosphohydrolase